MVIHAIGLLQIRFSCGDRKGKGHNFSLRAYRGEKLGKKWWTGLDSNQRTENRADLQSAAFNHSATCPRLLRVMRLRT